MAFAETRSAAPAGSIPPLKAQPFWLRANWGVLLGVAALVVIALLPTPQGLPVAGQRMLALLAFAVFVSMTEALDLRGLGRGYRGVDSAAARVLAERIGKLCPLTVRSQETLPRGSSSLPLAHLT